MDDLTAWTDERLKLERGYHKRRAGYFAHKGQPDDFLDHQEYHEEQVEAIDAELARRHDVEP